MKTIRNHLLTLFVALNAVCAFAQPQIAEEKSRLARDRDEVEQRYKAAQEACQSRFAVTGCTKDASKQRTADLEPIRKRELALREMERKQHSEEQLRKLEQRKAEAAQKQVNPASSKEAAVKSADIQLTRRQENEKRFAEKTKSAQEHRLKVDKAQQEKQKPKAQSLPVPTAANAQ